MKLSRDEHDVIAERKYREQEQRELDAYRDGRQAGQEGLAAGLCPDYPSRGERDAWLRGWRETITHRRAA